MSHSCSPLGATTTIVDLRYTRALVSCHNSSLAYRERYAVTRKGHGTHGTSNVVVAAVHAIAHHRDRRVQDTLHEADR